MTRPTEPGRLARADDRDRGRHQHVPHARHVRRPLPHGDRIAVGAQGRVRLIGRQRERQVIHAVHQGALRLQPGVGEHPQHGRVLAQRLRGKGAEPPAAAQRDQVLQEQHADAAVLQVIGDRERDLRGPGPSTGLLVGAAADHLAVQHGQQRRVVRPGLAAYPACLPLGNQRTQAEEAQVQVVRGHLGVHVPHRVEVIGPRGPDLDRDAVDQQSVSAVLRVCAHAALPVLPSAGHVATQFALSVTAAPSGASLRLLPLPDVMCLSVAIVSGAAFFMLNRRAAARLCGAAPGRRDGHPRRAAQPQRAGDPRRGRRHRPAVRHG